MKQIRNNVFETNSSSTHVLCLNKNMLKEKHILGMNFTKEEKYPDEIWDNYLLKLSDEFANMSFDTDWYSYPKHIQSPYQKLRYIYTYCMERGKHWIEAFAHCMVKIEKSYFIKIAIDDEDVDKCMFQNEREKYIYENNIPIKGIKWRKRIHKMMLADIKMNRVLQHQKLTILHDEREDTDKPIIYACTHAYRKI